jgi:hypothetical protein
MLTDDEINTGAWKDAHGPLYRVGKWEHYHVALFPDIGSSLCREVSKRGKVDAALELMIAFARLFPATHQ